MTRLRQLVKYAGRAADRIVPPPDGVTVLIYHRVGGGSDSAVDLDADVFDRQLAHLVEHHRVLSLDDAVAELAAAQPNGWAAASASNAPNGAASESPGVGSEPGVVVTFDDGTADFHDVVVPILERHGVHATLYAATHFIESGTPFPWGAPPARWSALADAAQSGLVAIESHTHTHPLLDRVDAATIDVELDRSIELIGEHIGRPPRHFAYPKAVPGSPGAEVAVRRRFASAALARSRVNRFGHTDLHRLWRTPIQRTDDDATFARKAAGGLRLEGELRALTSAARYRRER